jgi:hypothetical protein
LIICFGIRGVNYIVDDTTYNREGAREEVGDVEDMLKFFYLFTLSLGRTTQLGYDSIAPFRA